MGRAGQHFELFDSKLDSVLILDKSKKSHHTHGLRVQYVT